MASTLATFEPLHYGCLSACPQLSQQWSVLRHVKAEPLNLMEDTAGTYYKYTFSDITSEMLGARGSIVVKALCYKPEGRGFDTR
jgi:hypothetical protein